MHRHAPVQNIFVYRAQDVRASDGVNRGDALGVMEDLVPDDNYLIADGAKRSRLAIQMDGQGQMQIEGSTETGRPGAALHLDCVMFMMSPQGRPHEALVLVELAEDEAVGSVYLLPLSDLRPGITYHIVSMERRAARRKFAEVACLSFARDTHITMSSGAQVPVQDLRVGDRVLTRDSGPAKLRWIGQNTVRAQGALAPIVITAGTLNNSGDLVVSPNHRLFLYQRADALGTGNRELMVKARHLVNGDSVYVMQGGFVEYYQLLFDRHHIIYAEGIAAESFLIEPRTRPALPADLVRKLGAIMPRHDGSWSHGQDVQRALLDRPDAIDLLKRASSGRL